MGNSPDYLQLTQLTVALQHISYRLWSDCTDCVTSTDRTHLMQSVNYTDYARFSHVVTGMNKYTLSTGMCTGTVI